MRWRVVTLAFMQVLEGLQADVVHIKQNWEEVKLQWRAAGHTGQPFPAYHPSASHMAKARPGDPQNRSDVNTFSSVAQRTLLENLEIE
nr:hypothetical protein CFP56_64190 [Quercus suber]